MNQDNKEFEKYICKSSDDKKEICLTLNCVDNVPGTSNFKFTEDKLLFDSIPYSTIPLVLFMLVIVLVYHKIIYKYLIKRG